MATSRPDKTRQDRDAALAKIAGWPAPYAERGVRMHDAITAAVPDAKPRIWYGAPGYARSRSAPVLVFFRCDDGVMSFGLTEKATIEQEAATALRPSAWFVDDLDDATLEKIADVARTAFR